MLNLVCDKCYTEAYTSIEIHEFCILWFNAKKEKQSTKHLCSSCQEKLWDNIKQTVAEFISADEVGQWGTRQIRLEQKYISGLLDE